MTSQNYKVATGINLGVCTNKSFTWDKLVAGFTHHIESSNKGGKYFIGGWFEGNERKESQMLCRSLLTFDIDDSGMSLSAIQYELLMYFDSAFVVYSTYSHSEDKPKLRVVVPLSREVTPLQYRSLSLKVSQELGIPVDKCSFIPNQVMYMPSCPDISKAWSYSQDGSDLDVEPHLTLVSSQTQLTIDAELDDAVRGLELAVRAMPSDISDYDVQAYLDAYPAGERDYGEWFEVCTALYHQYQGSDKGFNIWYQWSLLGNEDKEEWKLRDKWHSLEGGAGTLTFGTVIMRVKATGAKVSLENSGGNFLTNNPDVFEQLLVDASDVSNLKEYSEFKDRILTIPTYKLGSDLRGMLASELAHGFGKTMGATKAQIAKALTPIGKANGVITKEDIPLWCTSWVYVETECQFYNVDLNYGIRREAFDAKYNREPDVIGAGVNASVLALVEYKIPIVVGQLFWPGCGTLMRWQGKAMVNTYRAHDIVAVREYDPEGLNAVRMFEAQLNMLLPNKREQGLLLNWLAFVYQNAGKRLNWSIILQGTQGSGKTFFSDVLKMIMGSNVRELAASAIGGRFSGWATGCLLNVVEEIRVNGVNRYEIMDAIKPFITNSEVGIERKGRDHETVPNFTSYLFLTNHKDAVPIVDGDRRYCILFSKIQTEEQLFSIFGGEVATGLYFENLYNVMRANTGAMAKYFTDYVIPVEFKPYGRAPATDGKVEMAGLSISEPRQILEDLLDRHRSELINDEFIDTTELNKMCIMGGDDVPKTRSLSSILLEKGFRQIKGRFFRTYKPDVRHCIWIKEGLDDEYAINKIKAYLDDSY